MINEKAVKSPMNTFDHRQPEAAIPANAAAHGLSQVEFVCLMAVMMALTALSIDMMLPALPAIGEAMGVADPNNRQIVIISYRMGFAVG